LNRRTKLLHCAIAQKQIHQVLIRHPQFRRHLLEVIHRRRIQANGDLALQLLHVRVLPGSGKIVFGSHRKLQYTLSSLELASRAEINRITELPFR
jgi:CRP-like cAMP-binding protein